MFYVDGLSYRSNGQLLFDSINFSIETSSITAIFGSSGSGKSTLLYLLSGILKPDSGTIYYENINMSNMSANELILILRSFGFLLQSGGLFTNLNLLDNVAFPIRHHLNIPEKFVVELSKLKLESVGLKGSEYLYPHQLSGGMIKRAALARSLAMDPRLLILDEPFAGQDPDTIGILLELIKNIHNTFGTTILIVSHDMPETLKLTNTVYLLKNKNIVKFIEESVLLEDTNWFDQSIISEVIDGKVN